MSSYKEKDILYEDGDYALIKVKKGYEVLRAGTTAADVVGIIGTFPLERAMQSALWMIERDKKRQAEKRAKYTPRSKALLPTSVSKGTRRQAIESLRASGHDIPETASTKEVRAYLEGLQ
jgi:hypothetical protein